METLPNLSSKALLLFSNLSEDMGWYGQSVLESIQLKRKENTWLLVVKVKKKGVSWVCFAEAETIDDAIKLFEAFCLSKATTGLRWTKSRY